MSYFSTYSNVFPKNPNLFMFFVQIMAYEISHSMSESHLLIIQYFEQTTVDGVQDDFGLHLSSRTEY